MVKIGIFRVKKSRATIRQTAGDENCSQYKQIGHKKYISPSKQYCQCYLDRFTEHYLLTVFFTLFSARRAQPFFSPSLSLIDFRLPPVSASEEWAQPAESRSRAQRQRSRRRRLITYVVFTYVLNIIIGIFAQKGIWSAESRKIEEHLVCMRLGREYYAQIFTSQI